MGSDLFYEKYHGLVLASVLAARCAVDARCFIAIAVHENRPFASGGAIQSFVQKTMRSEFDGTVVIAQCDEQESVRIAFGEFCAKDTLSEPNLCLARERWNCEVGPVLIYSAEEDRDWIVVVSIEHQVRSSSLKGVSRPQSVSTSCTNTESDEDVDAKQCPSRKERCAAARLIIAMVETAYVP